MIFEVFADGRFEMPDGEARCVLGRGGAKPAADKREGDGATPLGTWPIRRVLYRPDKGPAPQTTLPTSPISPTDGWCDASDDPAYNRPVQLPYPASAERMWRGDALYDLVVVLGHNDDPVVAGMGSAIFVHIARHDGAPTEGCVALGREDLEAFLRQAKPGDMVRISSP
jgi:L,D-peptidoglycan transpeptidase YkuD (ErfK/YbiS/YcfS/YnhG family)